MEAADQELITMCLAGRQDAFSGIVGRYKKLVYGVIYNFTGSHSDSSDLFQEVFLRIYRSLNRYNPEYTFSTWAMKIATNVCLDWLKKKKPEPISVDDIADINDNRSNPEEQYLANERAMRIRKAVNGLPAKYRAPVVLFHQQGMSYKDMAVVLELPETVVKNRLYRARLTLRELLGPDGEVV